MKTCSYLPPVQLPVSRSVEWAHEVPPRAWIPLEIQQAKPVPRERNIIFDVNRQDVYLLMPRQSYTRGSFRLSAHLTQNIRSGISTTCSACESYSSEYYCRFDLCISIRYLN